mgnify:CR=1 FL=1
MTIITRIIPACAGNSASISRLMADSTDHPRVCGELRLEPVAHDFSPGSSPRVRGTQRCPAPARLRSADHPRVCGELL